jgi:hypothetical protein
MGARSLKTRRVPALTRHPNPELLRRPLIADEFRLPRMPNFRSDAADVK